MSKSVDSSLQSSDSVRGVLPLRHARTVRFAGPIELTLGGTLPEVTVAYETFGTLSAAKDNAILICHALSGDSHVARHKPDDAPGWWDLVVGPGKAIDTNHWFVICPNMLGGCRGTTGPWSVNPQTGRRYGADFPAITAEDAVALQLRLLDELKIDQLEAVVGGSLGGHMAITWAIQHPHRLRKCVAIATSSRLTSQALAFDIVGRNAILHDPHFHGGQYYDRPQRPSIGLALARMLGHITYLSREAMTTKFDPSRLKPHNIATAFEKRYSVGSYLAHQGDRFVERFDANSYVSLTLLMDQFDIGDSVEALQQSLAPATCKWLVMSYTSDWLFPPDQSRQIVDALSRNGQAVSYCNVPSPSGHDAFLLPDSLPIYGRLISGFLGQTPGDGNVARMPLESSQSQSMRWAHGLIRDLIPPGASVLDLGCGNGELPAKLLARGHQMVVGVENDPQAVAHCVEHGVRVIHADINETLTGFTDGQFDVVVLSETLQSVADTVGLLKQLLRIGRRAIVSFPNFAYIKLREMFWREGRSPKTSGLYGYDWYNTPNRRFPSIKDVRDLCREIGVEIEKEIDLNTETQQLVDDDPNRNADLAILLLRPTR